MKNKKISVMFVCMGNICRSPAAEAILRHLAQECPGVEIYVESCGIGDWHLGREPDSRMQNAIKDRGMVLTGRAQLFKPVFFEHFDYILVADHEVLKYLYHYARTPEHKAKLSLMTAFSSLYREEEVPDPYYEGDGAFDLVLDMLEESCRGFLQAVSKT